MQFADRGGIVSRKTRFFQRKRPGVEKRSYIFYFYTPYSKKRTRRTKKGMKQGQKGQRERAREREAQKRKNK